MVKGKKFEIGDEITFDEVNKLKTYYFNKFAEEAFGSDSDYRRYEKLKRNFKKKTKFKIIAIQERILE